MGRPPQAPLCTTEQDDQHKYQTLRLDSCKSAVSLGFHSTGVHYEYDADADAVSIAIALPTFRSTVMPPFWRS